MKKYIIKDSQGSKKTIYAENITHALSYVEDSKKINDSKFYAEEDASEAKRRASKYGLQIKVGKKVSNGPNRGFDEIYYIGPRDKLTKMLKAEGFDDDEIIDMIEDSKVKDVDISFDKRIKKAVERGKLHGFTFNGLYAMKASKAEFPELKQELEKRNYKNIMFSNNPYNRYNVFFKDEAPGVDKKKFDRLVSYFNAWGKPSKRELQDVIDYYKLNSATAYQLLIYWGYKDEFKKLHFYDSINESKVRDEASSVTTINALVNDEKAAIDSYNVAIKNLEGKLDEKAMQVLINIRNDERRHIENLYSILNGQVTEKNLEDCRMKDTFNLVPGDVYITNRFIYTLHKVLRIENAVPNLPRINATVETYHYDAQSGKIVKDYGVSTIFIDKSNIKTVFPSMKEAFKYLQKQAMRLNRNDSVHDAKF